MKYCQVYYNQSRLQIDLSIYPRDKHLHVLYLEIQDRAIWTISFCSFLLQSLSMNVAVIFYDGAELSFSDTDQDLNACQGK